MPQELIDYAGCDGLSNIDLIHFACKDAPIMELWNRLRARELSGTTTV